MAVGDHQSVDALTDGVGPVVEIAVHVETVAATTQQDGEVLGHDVGLRCERDLRRRSAHLQYTDRVAGLCDQQQTVQIAPEDLN